jgi:hypothetical protein
LTLKQYRVGGCDFDVRHTMAGTFTWSIPSPKTITGFASNFLKGWELGSIVSVSSGSPFTATWGADGDPLGTKYNGDFSMAFPNIISGCDPIHGGVRYLNPNCFAIPTAPASFAAQCGQPTPAPNVTTVLCPNLLGNAGRNSLYGPGLATVDFSVFKNTYVPRISESFNVQFRAEAFNVLNHANFAAPNFLNDANNSIFDASGAVLANAGVLGRTVTSARQIQLGVKLVW